MGIVTVGDLIDELKKYPRDSKVVVMDVDSSNWNCVARIGLSTYSMTVDAADLECELENSEDFKIGDTVVVID